MEWLKLPSKAISNKTIKGKISRTNQIVRDIFICILNTQ